MQRDKPALLLFNSSFLLGVTKEHPSRLVFWIGFKMKRSCYSPDYITKMIEINVYFGGNFARQLTYMPGQTGARLCQWVRFRQGKGFFQNLAERQIFFWKTARWVFGPHQRISYLIITPYQAPNHYSGLLLASQRTRVEQSIYIITFQYNLDTDMNRKCTLVQTKHTYRTTYGIFVSSQIFQHVSGHQEHSDTLIRVLQKSLDLSIFHYLAENTSISTSYTHRSAAGVSREVVTHPMKWKSAK